jgi:predicted CXXCH cytochrome family protein
MKSVPTLFIVPFVFLAALLDSVAIPSRAQETPSDNTPSDNTPSGNTPSGSGPALPEDYSCMFCHSKSGDLWNAETPVVELSKLTSDIHWQMGLRCHDCHGGNPAIAEFKNHREDPTFRSVLQPGDIPGFCGHCHSNFEYMRRYTPSARIDQEAEYWTSGHGRHLKASMQASDTEGPKAAQSGEAAKEDQPAEPPKVPAEPAKVVEQDKGVATCVSCHGHHGILAVKDTNSPVYPTRIAETCARCHADEKLMAGRTYNGRPLGHDQYAQWRQSVHGRALMDKGDLGAPACNGCHGNHGAMPPGVNSVDNACGNCHGKIAKLFAETRMRHKFEEVGLPGCATCHGSHSTINPSDEMLGMESGTFCIKCHNPQNPQHGATLAGAQTARAMRNSLEQLKQDIAVAEEKIQAAEQLGMEVRGPRFDLRQASDALTNARTLIHSFNQKPLEEALAEGLKVTGSVQASADKALRDHTLRRVWLAVSLVPILLVVGLLLLYIRTVPLPAASKSSAVGTD